MGNRFQRQAMEIFCCCLPRQANTQDPVPAHNFTITHRSEEQNLSLVCNDETGESSSEHVTKPQQESAERTVVAAIDFGTAFSGYAFSFRHEYKVKPLKISCNIWEHTNGFSYKAPTSILFGPDDQIIFGYDAIHQFADVRRKKDFNNWYFFERFKMKLFQQKNLADDTMLEDISGKRMKAMDVLSGTIGYMRNHLVTRLIEIDTVGCLSKRDIHWVITVPAIWNDKAKQFMRKSVEQLTLALEPEAASLLCGYLPTFHSVTSASGSFGQYQSMGTSTKYMILDLGGGTADFTIHRVSEDGTLQEIHETSGGDCGGTTVDRKFFSVMESVFGKDKMDLFKQKHPDGMLDLQTDFEIKKRTFTMESDVILKIPLDFVKVYEETSSRRNVDEAIKQSQFHDKIEIRRDKMRIKSELFSMFFEGSISCILNHIQELLQKPGLSDVSTILLVGGYSDSPVVRNRIRNKYPDLRVVHPDDSELAILKGAVLCGHERQGISPRNGIPTGRYQRQRRFAVWRFRNIVFGEEY